MSDLEAAEKVLDKALALREFEISQLAQRNNFFMIFQGVLFAGVLQSQGALPVVSFLACFAGLAVSLLQTGMAAGAKYWQERWEFGAARAEALLLQQLAANPKRMIHIQMFRDNTFSLRRRMLVRFLRKSKHSPINRLIVMKPSVSRIPIYTGLALSLIWLLLLLCTVDGPGAISVPDWIVGFNMRKSA